ncbi:hypothetical protein BJ989_002548 [Nocardioides perillae]|uniref:DUF3040 domain-containing protein n=2 Tax=Nocardioides perillae TaxID=1119534 RepID=A0A7Y9RY48_9ACTN|nr:hypothetical protein [Nocardioides perillae]
MLEQMERALVEEDPKFANTLRGTAMRRNARRRAILAGVVFAAGITVLMTGAVLRITPVGIVGFVIMLGAATVGLTALRGQAAQGGAAPAAPTGVEGLSLVQGGRSSRRTKQPRQRAQGSFLERMEQRWRRRREGY